MKAEEIEQIMRDHLTTRKIVTGEGRDSRVDIEIVGFAFVAREIAAAIVPQQKASEP